MGFSPLQSPAFQEFIDNFLYGYVISLAVKFPLPDPCLLYVMIQNAHIQL